MRKINNLQFEEQIFIWLIRQKRMLNKKRELHIWFCLNKWGTNIKFGISTESTLL